MLTLLNAGLLLCQCRRSDEQPAERDTIVDTIRVVQPIAKDSVVVRYKTVTLRQVKDTTIVNEVSEVVFDTVEVNVPIESKHYIGSDYEAWISGYEARLDSINVASRKSIVVREKPKRWSIGLQGGIGATSKGIEPYIGVGITYNLLSF